MRNRQVQILYGVGVIQILGLFCINKDKNWGIVMVAAGIAALLGNATGLLNKQEKGSICKKCKSVIPRGNRICPECGYIVKEEISEDELTEYIEKEKEMTSEQIDHDFEKIESISVDEMMSYDGDIEDFLQNRCNEGRI